MTMRTVCTVVRDDLAETVLAPFGERLARARHWQFREVHIKARPMLAVRKEAQTRFGLTKRQALANEFELKQHVAAWRGRVEHEIDRLGDRIAGTQAHIDRMRRKLGQRGVSRRKARSLRFRMHQKKRHVARLEAIRARRRRERDGPPRICFGGRRDLRRGDVWAWRARRDGVIVLTGSGDETAGNQTCQWDPEAGTLTLRLPDADAAALRGAGHDLDSRGRVVLTGVRFRYGHADLAEAIRAGRAVTWRLWRDDLGRWRAHASFEEAPAAMRTSVRSAAVGIDLNVNHVAVVVTNRDGNPVHRTRLPFPSLGTDRNRAAAMIGDAVRVIRDLAIAYDAGVVHEDLDFQHKKAALKAVGKAQARRLSAFGYARFQRMLAARCSREGIDRHAVNPVYTSRIGRMKYAAGYSMSAHEAAALVIARRGQGFGERFVCMGHTALDGPGRNRSRHRWSRWRHATPWRPREGAPRTAASASGSTRTTGAPPRPPRRHDRRRDARKSSGPPPAGAAVSPANRTRYSRDGNY